MPIQWPAIISLKDADELVFVGSQIVWESDAEFSSARYQTGDRLIDAAGGVYHLERKNQSCSEQMSLDQVLDLVRQHASVCGHCCVSKMGAPSIRAAIELVEHIE